MYSLPSSGRGQCGCDVDGCACDCACDTAFVSGGKEFKYFQPGCECDPNNCYNADYPEVSKGCVCVRECVHACVRACVRACVCV